MARARKRDSPNACRGNADHPCTVAKRSRKRTERIQRTARMCCVLAVLFPCRSVIAAGETDAPQEVVELVTAADQARDEGKIEDALATYRRALALAPDHEKAYEGLVHLAELRPLRAPFLSFTPATDGGRVRHVPTRGRSDVSPSVMRLSALAGVGHGTWATIRRKAKV